MDAVLMCGGRGSRLDGGTEKPLYEVGGRPMVDRVRDALAASSLDTVHVVASPHAPRTREHCAATLAGGERLVEAPGDGYVADLGHALERLDPPAVTVAADLPLLAGDVVDAVRDSFAGASLTVCVPAALPRLLGAPADRTRRVDGRTLAPTGVNVVAPGEREETTVSHDARLAVNVNRRADVPAAEALL